MEESQETVTLSGIVISKSDFSKLYGLCWSSIDPAIKRLCKAGSWPRPPRARFIRIGYDYYVDDLKGIQEVANLVDFLKTQQTIKTLYMREPRNEYILEDYWRRLLTNILAETDGAQVARPVFNKWFNRFVKELYNSDSVWRAVDVIDGLVLSCKKLQLDEYTNLMHVPEHDWYWLDSLITKHDKHFNSDQFFRNQWDGPFLTEKVTLVVTTMRIPKKLYRPHDHPINIVNQIGRTSAVISAVRYLKAGSPKLSRSAIFHLSGFPLFDPFGYLLDADGSRFIFEKDATISRSDYHRLRHVWQELLRTKHQFPIDLLRKITALDIAEGRFSSSYSSQGWFQNMLDLTIALEALFSPSDSQEISHRIALRCSWLLGQSAYANANDNRLYRCVKAMYDLRSRIVHGDVPSESSIQKWIGLLAGTPYDRSKDWTLRVEALEVARDIVRKSLVACQKLYELPKSGPHWPFPNDFDQFITLPSQQRLWQKAAGIAHNP